MGVAVTLRYLKELGGGRYEYRRRVPESVKATLGKSEWKRVFTAKTGAEVAREHARVDAMFEADVKAATRSGLKGRAGMTARAAAEQALREAAEMLVGISGVEDEDEARSLLADDLRRRGADPVLYRAVVAPKAELPQYTLQDARDLYLKEKLGGGEGAQHREARLRLEKVLARAEDAGMPLTTPLADLDREGARAVRDLMLTKEKKGGGKLKPGSVQRDLAMLKAVITYGIKELGLKGKALNPFDDLPVAGTTGVQVQIAEWEKKDPLPEKIIRAVRDSLDGDLKVIWRLLDGTGCRLAEIVGLRMEDVVTTGDIPHIKLRWHEVRRLKNLSSVRSVPLLGDALEATLEAVRLAEGSPYLFPRYARERGPDAASAVLMKYVRKVTQDPRHTVHSLRHTMKARLRKAGVEKTTQDLILGHMAPSEGERYGGEEDRLTVAFAGMRKVAEGGR